MMVGKSDGKENWLEVGKEKGEGRCFASRQPLLSRQPVTLVHACTEWCKETEHGLWVWKCISGGRGLASPLYYCYYYYYYYYYYYGYCYCYCDCDCYCYYCGDC